jgi:hypothetical protein
MGKLVDQEAVVLFLQVLHKLREQQEQELLAQFKDLLEELKLYLVVAIMGAVAVAEQAQLAQMLQVLHKQQAVMEVLV